MRLRSATTAGQAAAVATAAAVAAAVEVARGAQATTAFTP